MIKEFHFRFDELVINLKEIFSILGFDENVFPEPFGAYMGEVLQFAHSIEDIHATYRMVEDVTIDEKNRKVTAANIDFEVGKTVCKELLGSECIAFFVCTAGKTLSDQSEKLLKGENPVLGYMYDVMGSAIADAAGDRMQGILKQDVEKEGLCITNRYSPGYCQWNVADQHKLFSLFHQFPSGVRLTPSALMQPVKSISGLIGIGHHVKFREYQCTLCSSEQCVYRRIRQL